MLYSRLQLSDWEPKYTARDMLACIRERMRRPSSQWRHGSFGSWTGDKVAKEAAALWQEDRAAFVRIAREWTALHAQPGFRWQSNLPAVVMLFKLSPARTSVC